MVTVILSFRDTETARIWRGERSKRLPSDMQKVALRKLRQLAAVLDLGELRVPPGNRLEALRADRAGQHSIRINDQWRICFVWTAGGPKDVEIVDYHR
jgi:proteic killer suppression protein